MKIFFTFIVLLCCYQVKSQCLSTPDVLDSLSSISNRDIVIAEKIKRLQQLQKSFMSCYKVKDSVYARIVHRLGDFYNKAHDLQNAIFYTREAVAVNATGNGKGEKAFLANSYYNLGLFYNLSYLSNEALNCFDSCIFISSQFPEKYFIAFKAFAAEAVDFFATGDYQKCMETADRGILFAKKVKDSLNIAQLLSQKAQAQIELNHIGDATRNLKQSISLLENRNSDSILLAATYSIYAHLLNKKGEKKTAIQYYRKSFNLNKSKANWLQCSKDMLNLGLLYDADLHDDMNAIACYKKGIKMLDNSTDHYQLAGLYINTGVVHWRKGDYKEALGFYQKALNVLPIQFSDTSIKANPSVAMLKLVANDYFISTLLSNKGEALLCQYRIEKREELLHAALNAFEAADKSVDLMRWKQYGEQSKLFWREKTKSMYGNAIEVCYLSKDVEKAFYFFEKSRAVLLNDKLSELGAKKFLSPSDNIKEQQLRIKVSSLNQKMSSLNETTASYNSTRQQMLTAQEEWERFIKGLERKYPSYYQYKYENTIYPLRTVKSKLSSDNQSLIEFFNSDSAVYVLYVSKTKATLSKIPYKDYGSTSKTLIALCSDKALLNKNDSLYRAFAYELYDKLFKPLDVPPGRVIISPDDYFIPFEALLSDKNQSSSFLLKKYAFSYTYSMALLMKASNTSSDASNMFLGVAPVNYQSYLHQYPLQGADQSLKNIEPYFKNVSFLLKEDATKQQFLKHFALFKTVQIYSHADADSSGKEPVLYLYDSAININEIQGLEDFQTELIILSACKTGIGKNAKGEGVFSLARAFMSVGIPSTVTTLWQVDNRATYRLTEAFYKYFTQGLPKDLAMQKAKLEFIQSNDENDELPYFWAANIVLGKTDAIDESHRAGGWFVIITEILGVLAVVIFLFYIFKRKFKGKRGKVSA